MCDFENDNDKAIDRKGPVTVCNLNQLSVLSYNEAQVQPIARPRQNMFFTAGKTMEGEKIFLPTFMSSRE